jgi:hypothetical protein
MSRASEVKESMVACSQGSTNVRLKIRAGVAKREKFDSHASDEQSRFMSLVNGSAKHVVLLPKFQSDSEAVLDHLISCYQARGTDPSDGAAKRVFSSFFSDTVGYLLLPEFVRGVPSDSDPWRDCYTVLRHCMTFGWSLSRGQHDLKAFVTSAYRLWLELDGFAASGRKGGGRPEIRDFVYAAISAYAMYPGVWDLLSTEARVRRLFDSPAGLALTRRIALRAFGDAGPAAFFGVWCSAAVRFGYRVGESRTRAELEASLDAYRRELEEVFFAAGFQTRTRSAIHYVAV